MTFNIDNVYFKWDNSLKDKNVIVADSLYSLKQRVEAESTDYKHVRWDEESLYFIDETGTKWHYIYPITKFYVVLNDEGNDFIYTAESTDHHVFAAFYNTDDAADWCYKHDKFAKVAKAWLNGKEIQFRRSNCVEDWRPVINPSWGLEYEYRVKPVSSTDFKIGKIYRNVRTRLIAMCIAIDNGDSMPVCLGSEWVSEDDLDDWWEVEA